jgi:hypothetical protein
MSYLILMCKNIICNKILIILGSEYTCKNIICNRILIILVSE